MLLAISPAFAQEYIKPLTEKQLLLLEQKNYRENAIYLLCEIRNELKLQRCRQYPTDKDCIPVKKEGNQDE